MDNLISKQAAVKAVSELPTYYADSGGYYGGAHEPLEALLEPMDVINTLKALPTIDVPLESQWIPCSERLPEEKDAGILKKLGTEKRSEYVLATVEVKGERMTVTACTYDGVWHWNKKYAFPDYKIVAWMPLPKPYKEEE